MITGLIIASLFAVGVVGVFCYAVFTIAGRQDEADELAAKVEGKSDGI